MLPFILTLPRPRLPSGAGPVPARRATSLKGGRPAHEFYPTPPEAIRALLSVERFDGAVWEPACGDGAISKALVDAGYDTTSTDLVDHGYGTPGIDFLETVIPRAKHIVTNPPYGFGLGDRFLRHALAMTAITEGCVAMLLNIASLCSPTRHASFIRRPPSRIYALDDCVCWPNGRPEQASRYTLTHRYAWLIWEPETAPVATTEFRWLTTAPFTDRTLRLRSRTQPKSQRRTS